MMPRHSSVEIFPNEGVRRVQGSAGPRQAETSVVRLLSYRTTVGEWMSPCYEGGRRVLAQGRAVAAHNF